MAAAVGLAATACTTDQGGYGFTGINQTDHDVVITLDSNDSPVRLLARTKAGIAFGWSYLSGGTLTVMDDACSVLGSTSVVGPSTVLTVGDDGTLTTNPDRRAFDAGAERLVSAENDWSCQPFRLSNRTKQDLVFRFGDQPTRAVFVPACGDAAFDPVRVRTRPPTPSSDIEVRYAFPPGQPSLVPTVTITAEQISTGYATPAPPCRGLAPRSTPNPS